MLLLIWQRTPAGALDVDPLYLWLAIVVVVMLSVGVIAALRKAAAKREARLLSYKAVFWGASEPVLLLDDDLTVVDANEAAARMLGQTAERLRRTRLLNWISPDI